MLSTLAHHGILYVPFGYSHAFPQLSNLEEVHGGKYDILFSFPTLSSILVCDSMCHDDLENQVDRVDELASKLLHAILSHFPSSSSRLPAFYLSDLSILTTSFNRLPLGRGNIRVLHRRAPPQRA